MRSLEGPVAYDELLERHELRALPAHVDPSEQFVVVVAPEADAITTEDCCAIC